MKEISDITACVIDTSGYFIALARRLAEPGSFGKVHYHNPNWQKGAPLLNEAVVGAGFAELTWCEDFWPIKNKIDLFIFPDLNRAGTQLELRSQGFPVWGAADAMDLETRRGLFLEKLLELGLDVPKYQKVIGITALRDHLRDKEDIYIKVSKWRGTWETKHWRSWRQDAHKLDFWAVKLGGMRERMAFYCFPKIETKLEIGGDTYSILGQWPDRMLHGIEKKDSAYFAAVTARKDMPEELTRPMDAFSDFLRENGAVTQWSMEVRVRDDLAVFLDPTLRGGLPSTPSQLLSLRNLPEIIYRGAQGELVQPDYEFEFTAEAMVRMKGDIGSWETIIVPEELRPYLKLAECCEIDGQIWFPADEVPVDEIGWLVAGGHTPTETAKRMNELADMLPDGVEADVEGLADVIREVEAEHQDGIKFTDQPMPSPEVVLEESE